MTPIDIVRHKLRRICLHTGKSITLSDEQVEGAGAVDFVWYRDDKVVKMSCHDFSGDIDSSITVPTGHADCTLVVVVRRE